MPSVQQIVTAFKSSTSFLGDGTTLAFIPPILGLIRPHAIGTTPSEANQDLAVEFIDYTLPEVCNLWVPVPTALIDSIDLIDKRECDGRLYDFARITFKLPTSPESVFLAGILQLFAQPKEQGSCSCDNEETRRTAPACKLCQQMEYYDDLVKFMKTLKRKGIITNTASCRKYFKTKEIQEIAEAAMLYGGYPAIVAGGIAMLGATCFNCACDRHVF